MRLTMGAFLCYYSGLDLLTFKIHCLRFQPCFLLSAPLISALSPLFPGQGSNIRLVFLLNIFPIG